MGKPQIKFCRTRDGGRLAYFELGTGSPVVYLPPLPQHLLLSWEIKSFRDQYNWLAARHRLVRFDGRGTGLSQPPRGERRLDAAVEDIEDLRDHLKLESFALMGLGGSGLFAIAYAAAYPKRVERLVLWNAFPSMPALNADPRFAALAELARTDWILFTQTLSGLAYGWADAQETSNYAALLRESTTQAEWLSLGEVLREADVVSLLPRIVAPTLVVQNQGIIGSDVDPSGVLASDIPNASLRMIGDVSLAVEFSDPEISDWLETFLAGDPAGGRARQRRRREEDSPTFRTILFTDLVGHTEMMSRLGDEAGRSVLREHERLTREVLKANGGTEVKTMGDGFMASFSSVTKAVECAVAFQRAFAEREGEPLHVRVGLNAGEPIEEDGDLFGATVILASRIAAKADAGEILVSDNVRSLCSGKGFLFADRGDFVAKGFEDPVRIYEVSWRG